MLFSGPSSSQNTSPPPLTTVLPSSTPDRLCSHTKRMHALPYYHARLHEGVTFQPPHWTAEITCGEVSKTRVKLFKGRRLHHFLLSGPPLPPRWRSIESRWGERPVLLCRCRPYMVSHTRVPSGAPQEIGEKWLSLTVCTPIQGVSNRDWSLVPLER